MSRNKLRDAKTPEKPHRNSFQEAAEKAGVPLVEFKEWMLLNVPATPPRWTLWNNGTEPIPDKLIIRFLREKYGLTPRQ